MNKDNPVRVEVRPATANYPKHTVLVFELKFDSIRQETYWVLRKVRGYRLLADAKIFANRF